MDAILKQIPLDPDVVLIHAPDVAIPLRLSPERLAQYRADPELFAAEYFRLSKDEYLEWIATRGVPQCGALTRRGKKCSLPLTMRSLSADKWKAAHRASVCPLHRDLAAFDTQRQWFATHQNLAPHTH